MQTLARLLVRLYPRAWRARYEDEVLALLEQDRPGIAALGDLGVGLVRERVSVALFGQHGGKVRLGVAGFGDMLLLLALGASLALLSLPTASWAAARGAHTGPDWLSVLVLFPLMAPLRWLLASLALNTGRWRWVLVNTWELALWCLVFFATCVATFLPHVTAMGLRSPAPDQPLWMVALRGTQLQLFSLGTRRQFDRSRRAKELREAARAALRNDMRRRPSVDLS